MLFNLKTLRGYRLHAVDGTIGEVKECFFDDHHWAVRYLVADTGTWLTGRAVLISPHAIMGVDPDTRTIHVKLTKKQIEDSPALDADVPVTRQFEQAYYGHYGWPVYWGGPFMWGPFPDLERDPSKWGVSEGGSSVPDQHLLSTHDVTGYHIQASDGEVGHVDDFIVDDEAWALRYLVVNTSNWWPEKQVLIALSWVERVGWSEEKVFTHLSRSAIKLSAEYSGDLPPTRDYESQLHCHYDRPKYWESAVVGKQRG